MNQDEITKKIQDFLIAEGFKFGNFGCCAHHVGIDYACAYVRPEYTPMDGAYTITVDTVTVKGWVCRIPYNHTRWCSIWQVPYASQKELVEILKEKISPPVGCWGNP